MKTLREHNKDRKTDNVIEPDMRAGIMCDDCDNEMQFSDNVTLACLPPKRNVHCPICRYTGYMKV